MTLKEAKQFVDAVNEEFSINNPMASLKDASMYRSRLLDVKKSVLYTEAKRLIIEAAAEKKGA